MTGAPSAKVRVQLHYEQRSDVAAAAVLRSLLELIGRFRDGALLGEDLEYLHRLRISVRRSRTVQRQLATVFPVSALPGFRSEFRWLQRATGEARDLDVYLEGFKGLRALIPDQLGSEDDPLRGDLEPLRMVLEHWRLVTHAELARVLLSRRTDELMTDWEMLLESLVEVPTGDRPDAEVPIGELAGHRIHRVYERVVHMGEKIDADSPAEALHEMRKKGKELRYMLELFGQPLFAEEIVEPMVKSLKGLQDVLGRHQDRQVQAGMLLSLADEVATLPRGARAVMAMGALVDQLLIDQIRARGEFGERFAGLAAPEQRQRVAQTFGAAQSQYPCRP